MQFADFRSANLFGMLTHQVRPETVLDARNPPLFDVKDHLLYA